MSWLWGSSQPQEPQPQAPREVVKAPPEFKPFDSQVFDDFAATCLDESAGWTLAFEDPAKDIRIYTKPTDQSPINLTKARKLFRGVAPEQLFDVLNDPMYRRAWDDNIIEGYKIAEIDAHNAIVYHSSKLPTPISNRDFVNHRGWTIRPGEPATGKPTTYIICNNSVVFPGFPEKEGFVRGWSFRSGYYFTQVPEGTELIYCTLVDPRGWIPTWLLNQAISVLGPRVLYKLEEAIKKYPEWFKTNRPDGVKPWQTDEPGV